MGASHVVCSQIQPAACCSDAQENEIITLSVRGALTPGERVRAPPPRAGSFRGAERYENLSERTATPPQAAAERRAAPTPGMGMTPPVQPSAPVTGEAVAQPPPDLPRAAIELDHLPLCPKVGCSFSFLQQFARQKGQKAASSRLCRAAESRPSKLSSAGSREGFFTMGTVCASIIKPQTTRRNSGPLQTQASLEALTVPSEDGEEGLSYAELAMRDGLVDVRGQPAFAKATHFVSHAWRYEFRSFVEALQNWLEQSGTPEDGTYFWVDAFVVNQHTAQTYPQEWWSTRFMQAVGEIGNTILVLEPWHNPVPFTRAWVIWELYCTSVTGARLHLTMRPQEMRDFNQTLVNSFERVQNMLSNLDVSKCEAFHQCDQEMIHGEIRRTIGFSRLNELVQTRLQQWLAETARYRLAAMRAELHEAAVEDATQLQADRLKLQDNLARMLRESGNVAEAEADFRSLLKELQRVHGTDHASTLSCVNQLAVTLQKTGKLEEALLLHRDCLTRRLRLLGPQHADSLQSASNLAVLLSRSAATSPAAFGEARGLFRQALAGREKTVGPSDVSTLYTVSSLGKLLSEAPVGVASTQLFAEAEALHQRAVRGLKAKLHEAHPITLAAMHAQAVHWLARYNFVGEGEDADLKPLQDIAEQLRSVHATRTEKLGRQHPDSIRTEQVLQDCTRRIRRGRQKDCNESWAEMAMEEYHELNTREQFREVRRRLRAHSASRLLEELEGRGIVDPKSKHLTTGMTPFNVFARIAAGLLTQADMAAEQQKMGRFEGQFIIVRNRPECDEMWESADPTWMGKASMSKRHRMLILKDLHWEWFNALAFGLVSGLDMGLAKLRDMREAVRLWLSAQEEWPAMERVGLFVHIYPHCSVNAFHLHIVDMDHTGPTLEKLSYKNLPLDDVIWVLEQEAREHPQGAMVPARQWGSGAHRQEAAP